ncbi:PAS sensor-containing methyl-accepting chemotaxis protein [Oleiphilus messinensis]|uniref:PAS sensor-containing methyl-accepting chemotaxis protein n=1 Tax=Oleiphilus messinensis TaxID=141451 RepID=A0A1Y0I5C6_9GAMM|nr:methyl-accepting chemotaxis protein [Oleiphilus messinensis]ARU55409.1 PAS sensor-containing methyl-accepting chemotaxis protein [Oleiphilus messinensis]
MQLKNISSKPLIVGVLVAISLAAIILSVIASFQARNAALEAQSKTLTRVVEVALSEAELDLNELAIEFARSNESEKRFRKLVKKASKGLSNDEIKELEGILDAPYSQRYITANLLDVQKIRVFDKNLKLIAQSNEGIRGIPRALHSDLTQLIQERPKEDKYKPLAHSWSVNGNVHYSIVYPVGGLRLAGYLEIILAPEHNLKKIDVLLGAPIRILSIAGNDLYRSETWGEDDSDVLDINYAKPLTSGEAGLRFVLREDISDLEASLLATQLIIVGLFILLGVVGVSAALLILQKNLFRPIIQIERAMSQISSGDLSVIVEPSERSDQLGLMVKALAFFVEQFKENKNTSIKAIRAQFALKNAATAMLMLNDESEVIFTNNEFEALLSAHTHDYFQTLGGLSTESIQGSRLDISSLTSKVSDLNDLNEICDDEFVSGTRHIHITIAPVKDGENRVGTVLEWEDKTEEVRAQEENRKITVEALRAKVALENTATAMMMANEKGEIIFANNKILDLFNAHASEYEVKIHNFNFESPIGEQFNAKETGLESADLNQIKTTISTRLVSGDQVSEITYVPVVSEGQRIGSVIEWASLTSEVRIQEEIDQLIDACNQGDLSQRIETANKTGFFKQLSEGLNQMLDTTTNFISNLSLTLEHMSKGNLSAKIEEHYQGEFFKISKNANHTIHILKDVLQKIQLAAGNVSKTANEVSSGANDLSRRTEAQASALEETAASMEQMAASVKGASESAQKANTLAQDAVDRAKAGGVVVEQSISGMTEILNSSQKINEIISVIDEIAFQTNLLALNAAVEAARAGDNGRGFAVVAGEVRRLSQRSAAAAKDIKDLIRDSVAKIETGNELVNRSGETLSQIVSSVDQVTKAISEVTVTANELNQGIGQINQTVTNMDEMTQQNASMVEQTSVACSGLSAESREMNKLTNFFRL